MIKRTFIFILIFNLILPPSASAKTDTEDAEIDMIMHQVDKGRQLRDAVMETVIEKVWIGMIRGGFLSGDRLTTPYTDIFIPLWQDDQSLVFFDLKVAITSQTNEENIGLGYRKMLWDDEMILGANIFYDTKLTRHTNRFHQLGFGLEALSHWVDSRANFYFPISDAKKISSLSRFAFGQTGLIEFGGFEEPLRGLDYEIGFLIPKLSDYFETRIFGGGFFYESRKADDAIGARMRLETYLNEYVTLEFSIDWPKDNEPRIFWGGYVTLPFELGKNFKQMNPLTNYKKLFTLKKGVRSLRERMTDRVTRDIDVQTDAGASKTGEQIEEVIFVDNSNDGDPLEDGTRSHPHNTLAEGLANPRYGAGKTIRVEEGDGTITGYTGNFVLANNSTLWGSGFNNGRAGTPTTTGNPLIDGGGAGNVITLGTGNTVMGLQIQNGTDIISGANPGTVTIRNNFLTAFTSNAIQITSTGATNNTANVFSNTIADDVATAFENPVNFQASNTSSITSTVKNNTITGAGGGSEGTLVIFVGLNSGTHTTTFTNNIVQDGGFNGIAFSILQTSAASATVSQNQIIDNGNEGIAFFTSNTASQSVSIFKNTITGSGSDGLEIGFAGADGTYNIDLGGGTLGSVGRNSIFNNTGFDINNIIPTATTIFAENNWWGTANPVAGQFNGPVDRTPNLTFNPN